MDKVIDFKIDGLTGEEINEIAKKFKEKHGRGVLVMTENTFDKLRKKYDLFKPIDWGLAELKGIDRMRCLTTNRAKDDVIEIYETALIALQEYYSHKEGESA